MDLGTFSISLSVKDIGKSQEFYEKLGFSILDGDANDKWLVMKNGNTYVGLFQDMFPKNTLTFMPADAKALQAELKKKGLTISVEIDENSEGPLHFMLEDPDGNPILFDQP